MRLVVEYVLIIVHQVILLKMMILEDVLLDVSQALMVRIDGAILIHSTVLVIPLQMMLITYAMDAVQFKPLGEIQLLKDVSLYVH